MRLVLAIWLVLLIASCHAVKAATWYVRPSVYTNYSGSSPNGPVPQAGIYGSQDGTSYANAWNGLNSILWGPTGVTNGDTVYICGTHIYNLTNINNYPIQGTVKVLSSGFTFRMDYPSDNGKIFGGAMNHEANSDVWFGPDVNGVYYSTNLINGQSYDLRFEVDGTTITRLNTQTGPTWTGNLGGWFKSGTTNYVKTLSGAAPSGNMALYQFGWTLNLNKQSNIVFLNCSFVASSKASTYGVTWDTPASDFVGANNIYWTNCTMLEGSQCSLYPGNDGWIFDSCEYGYGQFGIYGFFNSQTRGPHGMVINNCHIHDTDTKNWPDPNGDGHGIGARDASNWIVTKNHLERTDACVDFYCDSGLSMSNNLIADNLINDTRVIHLGQGTGTGGGIVFEGTPTAGLSASNRVFRNILYNIGLDASAQSQGQAISLAHRDLILCYNNTILNSHVGIFAGSGVSQGLNCDIVNNIVHTPQQYVFQYIGSGAAVFFRSDYNVIYTNPPLVTPYSLNPVVTHDTHSVFANPLFSSNGFPATTSFKVINGSPAQAAAVNVNAGDDFDGSSISVNSTIGAWNQIASTTNIAASACAADVQAAIDISQNGDTVIVPAGFCDYTNTVTTSKALQIIGAGIGQTIIMDDVIKVNINTTEAAIQIRTTAGLGFYRLTGFTFMAGTNRATRYNNGTVQVNGTGPAFRVDHCYFSNLLNRAVTVKGACFGVVDHCTFGMKESQGMFVNSENLYGGDFGDGSWANAMPWGTTNAIYVETCSFTDTSVILSERNALDCQGGARFVFRYNTLTNCNMGVHGSESGGRLRSGRAYEIYENFFTNNPDFATAINLRGGTGVIWSNNTGGYNLMTRINQNRSTDSFTSWGGATGFNPYDDNDPAGVFASGTHTGTNAATQLTKAGAGWTDNQWFAYTVYNSNSTLFSIIQSNTTDTIYYMGAKDNSGISNPLLWNTGDAFAIRKVIAVFDSVGRSTGTLMSNNPAVPLAWPTEALEPVYGWSNTLSGADGLISSAYPSVLENREFYNDTMKPGYTPLVYPHPLVTETPIPPPPPVAVSIQVQGGIKVTGKVTFR